MQLNDFSNAAISSFASSNFSMTSTVVSGASGDDAAQDESALFFHNPGGNSSIASSTIAGGLEDNLHILKQSGSAANQFTVTGSTFGFNNTTSSNNNILVESQNAGTTLNFTLQSSLIKGARADWINAANNSGSTMNLVIGGANAALGNTFDNLAANAHPGAAAGGNRVVLGAVGGMTFDINNNILKGSKGEAIRVRSTAVGAVTGNAVGNVRNNTIGVAATPNSGSSESFGIFLFGDGGSDMTVLVDNNDIFQYNNHAISITLGDEINNGSVFSITVRNNLANSPGGLLSDFNGFHLNNGTVGATDDFTTTIDISNNDFRNSGSGAISPNNNDMRLRQRQSTTVVLPGYGGPARDNSDNVVSEVNTYLAGKGNLFNTATANSVSTGGGYINGASPPLPLFAAAGGVVSSRAVEDALAPESEPPAISQPELGKVEYSFSENELPPPLGTVTEPASETPIADAGIVDDGLLSLSELNEFAQAAITRWSATGLTAEQLAFIQSVTFEVADMPGLYLGAAVPGHVTIDNDAAGNDWFIDSTPLDDSEFNNAQSLTRLYTDPTGAPAGKYDLLTTVMHELGHQLGLPDYYSIEERENLMYGYLTFGERRLPAAGQADGLTPGTIAETAFLGSPVDIGTLPFGKSVTIQWQATINPQSNKLITNPQNSGTVSATNAVGFADTNSNTVTTTLDTLTLGGTVWNDNGAGGGTAGNGIKDGTEPGVDGVLASLWVDADNNNAIDNEAGSPVASQLTSGGGNYSFTGLAPGNYIVRVDQDNFDAGGNTSLTGLLISPFTSPEQPDPDDNVDNDDNGSRVSGQAAYTKTITLAFNTETTAGTGNDTNNTLDLGFMNNPPPVLNDLAGDTSTFTEDGPAVLLDQTPAATVTDDQTHFNGGSLTASITVNEVAAEDVLGISTAGTVSITGTTVLVGGLAIGTITSNGTGGNDLVVSFNTTDATPASVSTLIQALTYFNSNSGNPSTAQRTIAVSVNDGLTGVDTESVLVNVSAVNDAPTVTAPASIGVTEDLASSLAGISFADVDAAASSVTATFTVSSGTLAATSSGGVTVGGTSSALTLSGSIVNINTFIGANNLTFTTDLNATADVALAVSINDNGNTGSGGTLSANANVTLAVTPVNDEPAGTDTTVTTAEDTPYVFTAGDFGFGDPIDSPANSFNAVRITTLPAAGTLTNNGTPLSAGDFVSVADINGGLLSFTPAQDDNGSPYTSFTFQVQDDGGTANGGIDLDQSPNTMTINVTEVNDPPVAVDDPLTSIAEDSGDRVIPFATLTGNDSAGPANEAGQSLTVISVNNAVGGTVSISGTDVIFSPAANFHGAASFDYTVRDNGTTNGTNDFLTDVGAVTFTIDPIADTPSVTDATTTVNTQTSSGLVITINPVDGPEVAHFQITGITNGTLFQSNGTTPINEGDFITAAEGAAGLKFTPAPNLANPGTTFGFDVQASVSNSASGLGGGVVHATVFVGDPIPPDTTIDTFPPAISNDSTPTFTFSGTDNISPAVLTFEYSVDGSTFQPAISPLTLSSLADGQHTFAVRAIDAAGNFDPSPAEYTWIVDTVAPTVTISSPSVTHANSTATVVYTITYADANLATVTLSNADITVNGTNGATATHNVVPVNTTMFEVHLTNTSGDGTISISVAAGTATDVAGNTAAAAGPSQTFVADNTKPVVTIAAPNVTTTKAGPVNWVVTVTDSNMPPGYVLNAADVQVIGAPATVTGTIAVTQLTATTFRVTVSSIFGGQGTIQISVAAGAAVDSANNGSDGPVLSSLVTVTGRRLMKVGIVAPPLRILPGSTRVFKINAVNKGSQLSTGVAVIVEIPEHATFRPDLSTAGWTDIGGGRFRLDIGDMAAKTRRQLRFAVTFSTSAPRGKTVDISAFITDDLAPGSTLWSSTRFMTFGTVRFR
jgi:hypothetical protein